MAGRRVHACCRHAVRCKETHSGRGHGHARMAIVPEPNVLIAPRREDCQPAGALFVGQRNHAVPARRRSAIVLGDEDRQEVLHAIVGRDTVQ